MNIETTACICLPSYPDNSWISGPVFFAPIENFSLRLTLGGCKLKLRDRVRDKLFHVLLLFSINTNFLTKNYRLSSDFSLRIVHAKTSANDTRRFI